MSVSDRERGALDRLASTEKELAKTKDSLADAVTNARRLHGQTVELQKDLRKARELLDAAKTDVMLAAGALLQVAADCHRGKWAFEDDCQEAFAVLHRIGDRAKAESDKLRD